MIFRLNITHTILNILLKINTYAILQTSLVVPLKGKLNSGLYFGWKKSIYIHKTMSNKNNSLHYFLLI